MKRTWMFCLIGLLSLLWEGHKSQGRRGGLPY